MFALSAVELIKFERHGLTKINIGILSALLLLIPITALANQDIIDGAFGVTLGEQYNGTLKKSYDLDYELPYYKIKPPSPSKLLDDYYVIKTKDNTVAQILGSRLGSCNDDYQKLIRLIEKKYSELNKYTDDSDGLLYVSFYKKSSDNRYIGIGCEESLFNHVIYIEYVDEKLTEKAMSEQLDTIDDSKF